MAQITYYLTLLLLPVLAVLFFWWQGRRQQEQKRSRLEVNRELYLQRIEELQQEHDEGLLSDEALEQGKLELDKRFVSENAELEQLSDKKLERGTWWPMLVVLLVGLVSYIAFGGWAAQKQADEAAAALPGLAANVLQNKDVAPTRTELEQFALGLRQKLMRDKPENSLAWLVYAQAALELGNVDQSLAAYEKAYQLEPERKAVLMGYAQLLVNLGGEEQLQFAQDLLDQVITLNPNNFEARSMRGAVAYQLGQWQQAVDDWQPLLAAMSPEAPRYEALQQAFNDAKQKAAGAQLQLTVTVTADAATQAQLPANGTLFVYVKAASGTPPMPAAVIRQPVSEFPVTVTLSDADAMLPDYRLSSLSQWQVHALVSADEKIETAPEDVSASPVVIEAQAAQSVSLTLTKESSIEGTNK